MDFYLEIIAAIITFLIAIIIGVFYKSFLSSRIVSGTKHNLPAPDYMVFVNREKERKYLQEVLAPENETRIVSIEGLGGSGKTALALAVAHQFVQEKTFNAIIYVSAKQLVLTADGIAGRHYSPNIIEALITAISLTLDLPSILSASQETQFEQARDALSGKKTLLIIDNFETATDTDMVYSFINTLPKETKVLITSRYRLPLVSTLRLNALDEAESIELIKLLSKQYGIDFDNEQAKKLNHVTNGIPLAIKFTIGRMSLGYSFESVLNNFQSNTGDMLNFALSEIMKNLKKEDVTLLLAFVYMENNSTIAKVSEVVDTMSQQDIEDSLVSLTRLNLVEKNNKQYSVHPFVRNYVRNSVPEYYDFSERAKAKALSKQKAG